MMNSPKGLRPPRVTFYGGVGKVTGANFLIEWPRISRDGSGPSIISGTFRVVVDCGMVQGDDDADASNYHPFPYDPSSIDVLIITHAHIDHIGRVPKLVRDGFRGVIYSTPETRAMAPLMFDDALGILAHRNISQNQAAQAQHVALYESQDVTRALGMWKVLPYHKDLHIGNGVDIYLKDAGHILGSAMVEFRYSTNEGQTLKAHRVLFTGDLGNSPTPLLRDTEEISGMDYVVMESVYGDRNHEKVEHRKNILAETISKVAHRGGTLLIPVFSLEKTQVLLHEMNELIESGKVPQIPVFLDSPLAIKLTDIYQRMQENFNDKVKKEIAAGDNVFSFPRLRKTMTRDEAAVIRASQGAKIIIAGSGMSNGGRIVQHEKNYLPNPNNAILFIGYQGAGTMGRQIQEGSKYVEIAGENIPVRAEIITITGYSSHKDSDGLVNFIETTASTVKKVFVVMGEASSANFLVQRLRDELDVKAFHPEAGESVVLS